MKNNRPPELNARDRRIADLYWAFKREADYPDDVATALLVLTSLVLERREGEAWAEDGSTARTHQ